MRLRLCTWSLLLLLLLLTCGLLVHALAFEPDGAGAGPEPLRALARPKEFALKGLATALPEAKDAAEKAKGAGTEEYGASGIASSIL